MSYNLKRAFLSLLSARVFLTFIGVLTLPIMVRVLGAGNYGDYAFLMATFGLMMLLVSPPITEGVQKFVAEQRDQDHWREQVIGFYFRLAVLLAILGCIAVLIGTATGFVSDVLEPRFEVFFYFLAALVIVVQLQNLVKHTLLGLGLEHYSAGFSIVGKTVTRGLGIVLAASGLGVVGFLVSEVLSATLVIIIGFIILAREVPLRRSITTRQEVPRGEFLSFNGLNLVTVVLVMSLWHVDVMMLRILGTAESTGHYKAALVLAEYIWVVPKVVQSLMLHSGSRLWSENEHDRIESLISTITRQLFLATSLLAIGIFVLADRFIPLYYGAEFTPAILPLMILMPGSVGYALARPIYGMNKGSGYLWPVVATLSVSAVLNGVANYVLIPIYGTSGAAVATSVSYGSMFLLQVICARHIGYSPLSNVRPVRLLATVLVAGPAIYGFDRLIGSDLVALALVPIFGFSVFLGTAVASGALDRAEIDEAMTALPKPLAKRLRGVVFDSH